jgi:hypothetical protein
MTYRYRLFWKAWIVDGRARGEVAESVHGAYTIERAKNGLFILRRNGQRLCLCGSSNDARRTADEAERDAA